MRKRRTVLISCKLFGPPNTVLKERGIPFERVYAGLPFTYEFTSNPRNKVPWHQMVEYFKNMEREVGGPEAMGYLRAHHVDDLPGNELLVAATRYFSDAASTYWAGAKMVRLMFPCVRGEYLKLDDGRVRVTLKIDEDQEDCPQIFRLWLNGMRTLPSALGLPESIVEMVINPRVAVYTITPAPSKTVMSRIRMVTGSLFAARTTINELSRQNEEMERYYQQLLETQQKLQEQEIKVQLSEQLAALSNLAALGEMAAGISHEINNPLMILYLQAGLLRRRLAAAGISGESAAPLLSIVQEIEQTGARISSITQGLLAFAGETHSERREKVTLCEIVRDAIKLSGERLRNAGVRIEAPPPTPVQIHCRRAQLSHALLNLINNAYDALQATPRAERWIRIEYSQSESEREIYISLSDNGPGVPAEKRDRIFEPFFTTRGPGKATGLGLSVAKGLVEANGGRLTLDASSNSTRFVITLPATACEEQPQETCAPETTES